MSRVYNKDIGNYLSKINGFQGIINGFMVNLGNFVTKRVKIHTG